LELKKRHGVKALGTQTAAMIAVSEADLRALIQALEDGRDALEIVAEQYASSS